MGHQQDPRQQNPVDAVALATFAFTDARHGLRRGVPLDACLPPLLSFPSDVLAAAAELVLEDFLRVLFAGGWAPVDLAEAARRRIDPNGTSYLVDLVVAATNRHPDQLVDARWRAQLTQIDGHVWWDGRRPLVSQWAGRDGRPWEEVVATVLTLLGFFDALPRIETVLPPPGTRGVERAPTVDPALEKVLARVRSLLAKAESTEFDDEAEALSAKAQELMNRHTLDHALLDQASGRAQSATFCRIWLDNPYVVAKSMLVDAVADANRCRTVLSSRLGFATVVGASDDLTTVELLTTSLLVQATRGMLSAARRPARQRTSDIRSFRQSFLIAYASRIGERLREANEAVVHSVVDEVGDATLLPVLAARSRAVDDLLAEEFPELRTRTVSVRNADGWGAGRAAADLARFDVHAPLAEKA